MNSPSSNLLVYRSGTAPAPVRTFVALDGLRGVAAIAVMMAHAAALCRPVWVRSAYLAVDLFFVLSGWVLAHAYGQRLRAGLPAGQFMRMRFARIMPLYLLGTVIALIDAMVQQALGHRAWSGPALLRAVAGAALLIPLAPGSGTPSLFAYPLNVPAWSLFFELLANAIYAALAPRLSTRRLFALVAAALVPLVGMVWWLGDLSVGASWTTFWGGAPRVVYSFFAGVLIYRLAARHPRRLHKVSAWLLLPALAILLTMPVPHVLRAMFDLGCASLLFPCLICFAGTAELAGTLQRNVSILAGRLSFPLYTLHVPILGIAESLLADHQRGPAWGAPATGMAFIGVTGLCAYAADRWFDRPVQGWLRRLIERRPGLPLAGPPALTAPPGRLL